MSARAFAAKTADMIVVQEIPHVDPVAAFHPFAGRTGAVLLDGAADHGGNGRWSHIALDPVAVIDEGVSDPLTALSAPLEPGMEGQSPFVGGWIGFLGYEMNRLFERLPEPLPDPLGIPQIWFGLYDAVVSFDHRERRGFVVANGLPERDPVARRRRAEARAREVAATILSGPRTLPPPDWTRTAGWAPELERSVVEARVARIVEYIRAGDVFQANFTWRSLATMPDGLDSWTLWRRLRALNPAPFAAFLEMGANRAVIGASPERFLKLDRDGRMEARPIKGTRPRFADPAADARSAAELLSDPKERAENLMICDLTRNDLGRVCRIGSIRVPKLIGLESFPTVHHLVSVVEGRTRPDVGPVDVLRACFPCGSIVGAPKVRAMEIIRELEPSRRGVYCGALGWIGLDGAMDMSVVIRTLTRVGNTVVAQAGGGVVADSDPAREWEEAALKMRAQLRALEGPEP